MFNVKIVVNGFQNELLSYMRTSATETTFSAHRAAIRSFKNPPLNGKTTGIVHTMTPPGVTARYLKASMTTTSILPPHVRAALALTPHSPPSLNTAQHSVPPSSSSAASATYKLHKKATQMLQIQLRYFQA